MIEKQPHRPIDWDLIAAMKAHHREMALRMASKAVQEARERILAEVDKKLGVRK